MSVASFLAEAEAEVLWEIRYYAAAEGDGGSRFRQAIEKATQRALVFPMAGQPYLKKTRRVFVRRYPFFVVYRPVPEGIVVFALAHESRRRGYWATRAR